MKTYFIKRFLLIIPTFLCITFLCFLLIQFIPGGPVEQKIREMKGINSDGIMSSDIQTISPMQRESIKKHFGFDKPFHKRYFKWLIGDKVGMNMYSYKYPNKTVWEVIKERLKISLIFGLTGFFLSYIVCIPLGILKAIYNKTKFDIISSLIIFSAYAIPVFAFGMILKLLFCGVSENFFDLFPMSNFSSDNFEFLSFWGKTKDIANHMFLPCLCYVIGSFAVLTMLMKNSLLQEVQKDYVRYVMAKGGSFFYTIWHHSLRNALIPIATGFGSFLSLMFAGSIIIEQVFEINGMGRLSIEAAISRDYPIFMGILALSSILALLGNILSDFLYILIDPRIDFN